MKQFVKKADLILLAVILALSVLGFVVLRKNANSNSVVRISVDGQIVKTVGINSNCMLRVWSDGRVEDAGEFGDGEGFGKFKASANDGWVIDSVEPLGAQDGPGFNILVIEDGRVWVSDANCPNGDCMHFGKISKEGQVILCLPHKLAVMISGGEAQNDAISY